MEGTGVREERRMDVVGRGWLKARKKGLATLHGVIHCAPEIITESSKSSFNASNEEEEKQRDNKGEADIHT